jgi:protein tyrosine phosphatase (PTP) superfamily phosphohydrolase (DUF442 family)
MLRACLVLLGCALVLFLGCTTRISPTSAPDEPPKRTEGEFPGLHNVVRFSDKLLSGSSPEGDAGFQSLKELGVKTIISVDGARPEVERARKFGLRYVHLPIGYDSVPREQALRIARAIRDLPGLIYIHCHHGQHRGPAAAGMASLCLDKQCSTAHMVALLHKAGTDPKYKGLYASVVEVQRPTSEELDRTSADFPETVKVSELVDVMVQIDERFDRLKMIRAASWKTPASHADLDPPHEALQLREQFAEAARLPAVAKRSEELRQWLHEAEQAAAALETALRKQSQRTEMDQALAEEAYRDTAALCVKCHAKYRDVRTTMR